MDPQEKVLRRIEDFVLDEHGLAHVENVQFDFQGEAECGYPYIRAANGPLIAALSEIIELGEKSPSSGKPGRFLEVGCGLGSKCELARLLGFESLGIDLVPGYLRLASQIFPECNFEVANALEFDYSPFDVVYYHVPFFEERLLMALESRIEQQVAPGAHLVVTRRPNIGAKDSPDAEGSQWIPIECRREVGRLTVLRKSV